MPANRPLVSNLDLDLLACLVDGQPREVRELFHYAVFILFLENKKAQIVCAGELDGQMNFFVKTVSGGLFSIAKPEVSSHQLEKMRRYVREIVAAERVGNSC